MRNQKQKTPKKLIFNRLKSRKIIIFTTFDINIKPIWLNWIPVKEPEIVICKYKLCIQTIIWTIPGSNEIGQLCKKHGSEIYACAKQNDPNTSNVPIALDWKYDKHSIP